MRALVTGRGVVVEQPSEAKPPPSRTRNVRLGDLEARIEAEARRAGATVSAWMRQALSAALPPVEAAPTPAAASFESAPAPEARRRVVLRASAAEVDRWEREAAAHALTLNRYLVLQMSVTPESGRRIAAAAETVRASLVELAAIGRNLNQLARSWNTYPGQSTAAERAALAAGCAKVDRMCERLSTLVGELEAKQGRRKTAQTTK